MLYKEMPESARKSRTVGDSDIEEEEKKAFRHEVINLNMGGKDAKEDQYIGTSFVPMRIVNMITKPGGIKRNAFGLYGFVPETGHPAMLYFDTKLRQGTDPMARDYVRNWGGGLAIELGTPATPAEAQALLDEMNAENGSDLTYEWGEWTAVGGLLKLNESKKGKPVVIGKQYKKIKRGNMMNIFRYTPLSTADFPNLQEDIEHWNELRGTPYDPVEEEYYSSSEESEEAEVAQEGSGTEEESVVEEEVYVPEPEPEPVKKTATMSRKPVTRTRGSREEAAKEVAKEFEKPVANRVVEAKSVTMSESIFDYIKEGYDQNLSTDQIIIGLLNDHGLKNTQAVEYVNAYLESREPKPRKPAPQVKTETAKPKSESELVRVAKECQAKGMDSPETFDILQKRFPNVSRDEKRAALKTAGLIKF